MMRQYSSSLILLTFLIFEGTSLRAYADTPPSVSAQPSSTASAQQNVASKASGKKEIKEAKVENVLSVASQAIQASERTMAENKAYYENVTTTLISVASIAALFVSAGGIAAVYVAAHRAAKEQAVKSLKTFNERLNDHIKRSEKFHADIIEFRNDISKSHTDVLNNLTAFLVLTPTMNELGNYCAAHGHKPAKDRPDAKMLIMLIESIITTCGKVLRVGATNGFLLGLTYVVQGTAFHLARQYSAAYLAFQKSLTHRPDSGTVLYNVACTTCQLGKKEEAKNFLKQLVGFEPHRAALAWGDADFAPLYDDPEFGQIVGPRPS